MSTTPDGNSTSAPAAPARPAATVILAREAWSSYEVLLLRRLANASSFADAFVFPGGVVREDDFEPDPVPADFDETEALIALTTRGSEPPGDATLARALFRAAIREVFEEAGVLLARDSRGRPPRLGVDATARWTDYRDALQSRQLTLRELLERESLTLDYRSLTYFSHWITPDDIPRRFDTRFFVARMPADQTAVHCHVETTESVWIAPGDALDRSERDLPLVLPTRAHLARLTTAPTLAELIDFAQTKSIQTVHARRFAEARIDLTSRSGANATW
jgi:8-oxo-dGTP pyrophosphatase MutT (NUDIX family)